MSSLREVAYDIGFTLARLYSDALCLVLTVVFRLPVAFFRWFGSWFKTPAYKNRRFKSVVITGASAGLGAALAVRFSGPGVLMTITARTEAALQATKDACEKKGAVCYTRAVDVRDKDAMKKTIEEAHGRKPIDLLIANAGGAPDKNGIKEADIVISINCLGVVHTVMPALDLMMREENNPNYFPQIVLMSSLGGFISSGSFFMMPYAASKNMVRVLGESLRTTLRGRIGVSTVFPGMTESRMVTEQIQKGVAMVTGVWPVERAINVMEDGIRRNSFEIVYPFAFYIVSRMYGSTVGWVKDLYAPITRSSIGDPYTICDKDIWASANLYK